MVAGIVSWLHQINCMSKLYPVFLAATLLPLATHAQITIGQAEMPAANDHVLRVRSTTNPFLNYAATGPAHTWNFGNLSATGSDTTNYRTVASTNFVYAIAYADLFFNANRANHAKPGVDIPFSNLLPIANPYTFRYRSSTVYKTVGFGAEVSGIPVPIIFSSHDVIYKLPIAFGDSSFSHSAYSIQIPTVGGYSFQQDRINKVDGWGVITTPAGTFDVLRVKTTLGITDEVQGITINRPVTKEYKWLAQGLKTPVLQINTTTVFGSEVVSGVWYYDVPRSINVVQPLATVLCPGAPLTVNYQVTGAFNAGGIFIPANQFRAQLSDASGSFASPVNIGSVQATGTGSINATIPANTPQGTGYRIRVVSTSPAYTGTSNTFNISIGGTPNAAISAGGPVMICTGSAVTLTAVGGPGYQWQVDGTDLQGAVGDAYEASIAGIYRVKVTNDCGSATSNAITVVVNEPPAFTVEPASLTSCADAPATITAHNANGQAGLAYQWFLNDAPIAGQTGTEVSATLSGQYTMEATNPATGCTFVTDGVMATVESVATPAVTADGPTTFCHGGSVALGIAEEPGLSYQWYMDGNPLADATGAAISAHATGVYGVVATSAHGCISQEGTLAVTVHDVPGSPDVEAHGPLTFCEGGSVMLSTSTAGNSYQWYRDGIAIDTAMDVDIIISEGGLYNVAVTNADGCTSPMSQSMSVGVVPHPAVPVVAIDGPASFCEGGSVVLMIDAMAGETYQWRKDGGLIAGATGPSITVAESGSYAVVAASAPGCNSTADAVQVTVHPLPAQPVITVQDGVLQATGTGSFQWFLEGNPIPGATNAAWNPAVDGNYTVEVADGNGCSSVSEPWLHLTTGVASVASATVRAYPNPTTGLFTVEVPGVQNLAFEVLDITGKQVASSKLVGSRAAINLGNAAEGIYFVKFISGAVPVIRVAVSR